MSWTQGKTLHTTRTGRAKPNGKVTRSSLSVRKTKYVKRQDKPLGFDAMCHPQALERTPRHPYCGSTRLGYDVSRYSELSAYDFLTGVGLVRTTRPLGDDWLLVRRRHNAVPLGFARCHDALCYRRAAADKGVALECYDAI